MKHGITIIGTQTPKCTIPKDKSQAFHKLKAQAYNMTSEWLQAKNDKPCMHKLKAQVLITSKVIQIFKKNP